MAPSTKRKITNVKTEKKKVKKPSDNEKTTSLRRTKREVQKFVIRSAEEEAQLRIAIRLSLDEQKKKKSVPSSETNGKKLVKYEKPQNSDPVPDKQSAVTSKKEDEPKKRKTTTAKPEDEPKKKKTEASQEPTKKNPITTEPPKSEMSTRKAKVKKSKAIESQSPSVPSTAKFISYILQKGSGNRDMSLVEQFEKT